MQREQAAQLIAENLHTVYSYALSRTGHREEAEDLAGDIVLGALNSVHRLREDKAFWGFFWAVAENSYRNYLRKLTKEKKMLASEEAGKQAVRYDAYTAFEDSDDRADLIRLKRELALLGSYHRECTVLYYFEGKKCSEIALSLGLSLDMVKYYLFKTRKLLKEGIGMERTLGEKSYRPGNFTFCTIFGGQANMQYQNLFQRKLPGQILLTAYYHPVTIQDLCLELGISSVYMEDEVELLKRYDLIHEVSKGHFQTNLAIFTEDYMDALWKELGKFVPAAVGEMLESMRKKLPDIRALGFSGASLEENRLLWALYVMVLFSAMNFGSAETYKTELYPGAAGVNYGLAAKIPAKYSVGRGFAGVDSTLVEVGYTTYAHFGIWGDKGIWLNTDAIWKQISGTPNDAIPSFTEEQKKAVQEILAEEIDKMREIYKKVQSVMRELFAEMASASVQNQIEKIVEKVCFFLTIGYFGGVAVECGALTVPEPVDYTGIFATITGKDTSMTIE